MSKNILTGGLLMILALSACGQSRKTTGQAAPTGGGTRTTAAGPKISSVYMLRTACFGRCPSYAVIINSNGQVEYQGRRWTKYTGVYQKNMGTGVTQPMGRPARSVRIGLT